MQAPPDSEARSRWEALPSRALREDLGPPLFPIREAVGWVPTQPSDSRRSFADHNGLNFTLVSDEDMRVSHIYGNLGALGLIASSPTSLVCRNVLRIPTATKHALGAKLGGSGNGLSWSVYHWRPSSKAVAPSIGTWFVAGRCLESLSSLRGFL